VLVIQTFAVTLIAAAGIVLAPQLTALFSGRSMTPEFYALSVNLIRLMLPYIILSSVVAFAMGYLNSHGAFFAPAFSTVLLNLGMIAGIVMGSRYFEQPVYGVAMGVLAGGMLQVLLQIPYMVKHGFRLNFRVNFSNPELSRVFRAMLPAVLGIAAFQVNALVSNLLAAMIEEGSVSYIYYTTRLTELIFGVFIVSTANVMLPEMSRLRASAAAAGFQGKGVRASAGNGLRASAESTPEMDRIVSGSISAAMFVAVPAAAGLIAAGLPIVSFIFMRGNFAYLDAVMTYRSLVWAGAGLIFMALARVVIPAFYTFKDTRIPLITSIISVAINLILGYLLMRTVFKHAGLTLAGCIASFVQSMLLLRYLAVRHGVRYPRKAVNQIFKILLSSTVMGLAVFYSATFVDWQHAACLLRAVSLTLIICGGAVLYYLCSLGLRVDEALYLHGRLRAYFR
jgi:putative peptidoglycan lipid II flippase